MSDNDIASFLKNIVDHSENFIAPGSGLVPYSFSNPFPLDRKSLGPAAKLLLVSSWQDSQVYCYFLPRDIESEYLQLAFNSKECRHELVDFFSFYPYPHLKAAEVERLDAVLTSDRKAMPSENRETLARLLKNVTQLPADIENKFSQANWYKEAAMPSEAVAEFKKYYFYERRKKIAEWLRNGREAFVLAINDLNTTHRGYSTDTDRENQQALRYLCLHVSERCGGEVSPDVRSSLGYILGKRQRTWKARRGLHWEETRYQLAQEVLKAEYWEKLTALKILE